MKTEKKRTGWRIAAFFLLYTMLLAGPARADQNLTADQKAAQIVSEVITSGMSEADKAKALHDWLTDHAYYDRTFTWYSPEGVLLHQTGVCQSYSEAYQLLLGKAGIDSRILTGYARKMDGSLESHAWNLVKIDGKWLHVDVTWDDPTGDDDQYIPISGMEHHMYFMVSTAFILTDHMPDEDSTALLQSLVGNEVIETLPEPAATKAVAAMPAFSLKTTEGAVLTEDGFGKGKKLMMVYGRTTCPNTTVFLSSILPYIGQLKNSGVTVLTALFDNPSDNEMKEMAFRFPGVVCARVTDDDNSMWDGLSAVGWNGGMITFPVIFLKNANNAITFCTTGYQEEPLRIVAGALQMNGDAAPVKAMDLGSLEQLGITLETTTRSESSSDKTTTGSKSSSGKTAAGTSSDTSPDGVKKASQTMTVKVKTVQVKASKLKKKKQTVPVGKAFTIRKNKGKVTFKKISGHKKITISKTGKITLKKGLGKGTYKIRVKVTAAGNAQYRAGSKKVTLKIRVK